MPLTLRGRLALAAALALGVLFALPGPAAAHVTLVASSPRDGAVLAAEPHQVDLTFSGEVSAALTTVTVIGPSGRRLDTAPPTPTAPDRLAVPLTPDPHPGTYVITWRTTAPSDPHTTSGALTFSTTTSGATRAQLAHPDRLTDAARDAAAALSLSGLALLVGFTAFHLLCLREPPGDGTPSEGAAERPAAPGAGAGAEVGSGGVPESPAAAGAGAGGKAGPRPEGVAGRPAAGMASSVAAGAGASAGTDTEVDPGGVPESPAAAGAGAGGKAGARPATVPDRIAADPPLPAAAGTRTEAGQGTAALRWPGAVGWGVLLGGAVLQLLLLGPASRGEPVTHAFSRSLLSASLAGHDGHALVARIMLLALVAAIGEQVLRHRVGGGVVAAVGALLLALTWSETGRAAGDGLALAVTTLHVTAMAVWSGGTATVAVLLARRVPDAGVDAAVGRFSRLTLWCVAVMAATGVYLALRATGLGDLLPAEAGLFLLLAAAAGRRKSRRLAPAALRRSVLLELAGLTAVVVLGALLAGTPPPGR